MGKLAEIMATSLTSLGWGPDGGGQVDLCGYHTGTMLATELAVTHPELVRRIVLMGIPYYDAGGRQERFDRLGQVKPWPDSFAAVAQDWIFAVEMRNEKVSLERAFGNYLESAGAWQGKARIYGAVFQYPAEERAPLLTQPTLILNPHGNLKEPSRAYAELIDGATLDRTARPKVRDFRRRTGGFSLPCAAVSESALSQPRDFHRQVKPAGLHVRAWTQNVY